MAVPTTQYDETTPAGSDNISQGDDRIRELKTQIREIVGVEHEFTSTQTAATGGQHLQVTLQEQADLGTGAVDATILGSQTVGGKGELVYTDEDDNDIQMTTGGVINAAPLAVADGKVLVGNGSGVATAVDVSGDAAIDNAGAVTVSDLTIASEAQGDILLRGAAAWAVLAKGTAYQKLFTNAGATALEYGDEIGVYNYGTSFSASTQGRESGLKICFGRARDIAGSSTQAVTNLPFTSATSYMALACAIGTQTGAVAFGLVDTQDSGSQFTLRNNHPDAVGDNGDCNWIAIGV